ncbi:MAG TPA: TolC family protein [Candidatus Acidoferrales bacterium]|nr:TolC family protein [Candidatus Acidoferrales bacterium]
MSRPRNFSPAIGTNLRFEISNLKGTALEPVHRLSRWLRFVPGIAFSAAAILTSGAAYAQSSETVRPDAASVAHIQPGQRAQANPAQSASQAPAGAPLTLEQARQVALANHPQVRAAQFSAAAAHENVVEQRAAYYPTLSADLTGVDSNDGRIAAGSLNNPIIFSRFAGGAGLQQLATDFGRTRNLVASASLQEGAAKANLDVSRADVLLAVDRAYYAALRAQAVLNVAQQTVNDRDIVDQQIRALYQSKLKSGLDLSFADVNLAQAKMLLVQAQNDVDSAAAELSRALGVSDSRTYLLVEPAEVSAAPVLPDLNAALVEANRERPDLTAQRFQVQANQKFATAERDLFFPTISIAGAAGEVPFGQSQLPQNYGAIGFDVHVPIFNGKLYNARHAEAIDREQQAEQQLRDQEISVARDVRVSWLAANTAQQNLALSTQLLDAANKALDLAQERYKLGLGSIVELSQAQLNQEQASIAQTTAKYDYATRFSELSYQEGALK